MTDARPGSRPSHPLVEAKLHPPAPRAGSVERRGLMRLLTGASGPPGGAGIAPPGYGKTTLLVQAVARESRPVAWLTLDDADNDPVALLAYLAAAFDRLVPLDESLRSAFIGSRDRVVATALPRLTSALHRWSQPAVLVLDDVHRLVDRAALDVLTTLIDRLPPGFRVIIAGRRQPDLPLARLRVQRDLLEIGVRLLALDPHETAKLTAAVGIELSDAEAEALAQRTEGWAAGIYLAALAHERGEAGAGSSSVLGSDQHVAAYLRSELEHQLEPDDVTLLTRTAILETIPPPAAEAVSGLPGAAERMRTLADGNLLIQEVGRDGTSHRYHNLLRDFLLAELEQREPGMTPELHQRAASWYATEGNIDLAITHSIAAGDLDGAARLVMTFALATFRSGNIAMAERWLSNFDNDALGRFPHLAYLGAVMHTLHGNAEEAIRHGDIVERATFSEPVGASVGSFAALQALLRGIQARNGPREMLADAERAVAGFGPESPWQSTARWIAGSARHLLGDDAGAEDEWAAAASIQPIATAAAACSLAQSAAVAIRNGDWSRAVRLIDRSREVVTVGNLGAMTPALLVHAVGARVAIRDGRLADARAALVHAQLVRPTATYAAPWLAVDALLELARAYLAIADHAGAQVVVREAEAIVRRRPALGILTDELLDIRRRIATTTTILAGSSSLTAAELRLLPLLPTYLSFQEIGDRLVISRHTVKSQAMSIYGKLQATSRGEAVERAVELGLLEPFLGLDLARRTAGD